MEPSHIPVTNLCKAELMRTELLIQAHEKQLAQCVKQLCNMDLHIYISTTKALSFHVHVYICDILPHRNNQIQLSVCTLEVTLWNI